MHVKYARGGVEERVPVEYVRHPPADGLAAQLAHYEEAWRVHRADLEEDD